MTLTQLIANVAGLPETELERFNALCYRVRLPAGGYFIQAGEIPDDVGFVDSGLCRFYYLSEEGKELTKAFFPEGTIVSSYSAMRQNRASHFSVQALEETSLTVFRFSDYQQLMTGDPGWTRFLLALIEKGYMMKEERERQFLLMDAESRYRRFQERFPDLEVRIKQHMLASYLRITPESLSRIRRSARRQDCSIDPG